MCTYVGQCELFSEEEEHLRQGVSMYVQVHRSGEESNAFSPVSSQGKHMYIHTYAPKYCMEPFEF
jgi:hypothetical protein